jgi:hypothetical protein
MSRSKSRLVRGIVAGMALSASGAVLGAQGKVSTAARKPIDGMTFQFAATFNAPVEKAQ